MNEEFAKEIAKMLYLYEVEWWEQPDVDEVEMLIRNYLFEHSLVVCKRPENANQKPLKKS